MLRENPAEAAATDDDRVEWTRIALRATIGPLRVFVCAVHRLVEAVAHVPAENIDSEVLGWAVLLDAIFLFLFVLQRSSTNRVSEISKEVSGANK